MFKLDNSIRLGLIVFGLALVVIGQNKAEEDHNADKFKEQMGQLVDDPDIRDTLMNYIEKVPLTHKSRKHAQRCFLMDHLTGKMSVKFNKSFSSRNTTTTTTSTTQPARGNNNNLLMKVMSVIFSHGKHLRKEHGSCKSCSACPKAAQKCIPCPPKVDCKAESTCAPCPLPHYCRPPTGKDRCPPKPICDVCSDTQQSANRFGNTTTTASQNTTSSWSSTSSNGNGGLSSKTLTTSRKPVSKTTKNPDDDDDDDGWSSAEPAPEIMNMMKLLLMNEQPQPARNTTTTVTSSYNESSSLSTSTGTGERAPSTTGKPQTTTKTPSTTTTTSASTTTSTSKKPKTTTTNKPSTTTTTSTSTTTSKKPTTTTTTKPSTTTTTSTSTTTSKKPTTTTTTTTTSKKPSTTASSTSTSTSTSRRPVSSSSKRPPAKGVLVDAKMTIEGKQTSSTATKSTTTTSMDGHSVTKTTTNSTSTTGSWLFEKNIKIVITNDTIREHILKMIEEIPNNTGGEEMKLAKKLLERFGEKKVHLDSTKRKGGMRSFTFMKARTNFKGILGHLMERYARKQCECKPCEILKTCSDCETDHDQEKCPPKKPNYKCPACSEDVPCPAPDNCPSYPACKSCPKPKEEPDDDGPLEDLDDIDPKHPVKEGELKKNIECKKGGFTCPYQKTCGKADKNPLTPKASQQGYMNGGEDEIYGEWPHFVSLGVRVEGDMVGFCGGVLISNRHVLTAAHCVHSQNDDGSAGPELKPDSFTATLGEHDKTKKDDYEVSFNVSEVCGPKRFRHDGENGSIYDYAVLTLDKNVTFNDNIQPACLPYKALELNKKARCYVVGLGITKAAKGLDLPEFAKIVQKMRVERASCKAWGIRHDDRSRHCFTKANAKGDTCGGDSGGPIICLSKQKRWTVMGLVSYGSALCDGTESIGWVGVYARVQALLKSIQSQCGI